METARTDAPPAARDDRKPGHGAAVAIALAGIVLAALLVCPGFLAAGFSRVSPIFCADSENDWCVYAQIPLARGVKTEFALLGPSSWLAARSPMLREFYKWQYRAAGGSRSNVP
ncbi:MAG TPA: hypothetical protein VG733_11730 [Chthoniobacteraceae bacterium]|nr:hypothetical protein [Chthoniobacteraceae bacterium]